MKEYRIVVYLEDEVEFFYYRTHETIEEVEAFLVKVSTRYLEDGKDVFEVEAIETYRLLDLRDETTRDELALEGTFFYIDDKDVSILEDGAIIEVRSEKVFIPYSLLRAPLDGKEDGYFIR